MAEQTEKTAAELLRDKLLFKAKNAYDPAGPYAGDIDAAYKFAEGYMHYLDRGKTEREVVSYTVEILDSLGYQPYEFGAKRKLAAGSKVYLNNRGKAMLIATIGKKSVDEGVLIAAAHIDSPRIDLKQRPLYEDGGMAFFKTHYYGGIKKYQWTTIPLALHGVVVRADGTSVNVVIGEDETDPVFCITDLLPHLGQEQGKKSLNEAIPGEGLNILVGSRQYNDEKVSDKYKLYVMAELNAKYGITEADFLSAELCVVPAPRARDLGIDRSMILAYGHDDRVCAYPSLMAQLHTEAPAKTLITVLADKEEIGSEGSTGMQSHFLRDFITELAEMQQVSKQAAFRNSKCLSADVGASYDPNYAEVYDPKNAAYLNGGAVITKYTGSRGKAGSSDASAEFVGEIRRVLDAGGVLWQTSELGKVDQGGGGTVAAYIANQNIETLDLGVPVLSMHAPFEAISKFDLYMTYKAVLVFFGNC